MAHETYVSRRSQLLRDFDRSISRVRQFLVARYGEEEADAVMRESRQEYEGVIPQTPYIGDRNPLLVFLLPATRYLAIYRTFQKHGRTVEDVGRLVYEIGRAEFEALPRLVRRGIEVLWFSRWFAGRLQRRAAWSRAREYPGGYVLSYVEGDGRDFDYGVDYLECASCKFLDEQGAAELAPYVCAVDKVASEMLGWGLRRTTTLAQGGERCDFRFKKGGETDVAVPPALRFEGMLIKESLKDTAVLDSIRITRTEVWDEAGEAPQPPTWTATWFEGDESQADEMAERLSRSLLPDWYANVTTDQHSFVVFGGKVFKYPRGDERGRAEAQAHGRSLGLPERQLEWGEDYPST